MYLPATVLLMLVLPLLSVSAQTSMLPDAAALMGLVGKWFTFWGVGVRLFLAGLHQVFRPNFTAEDVFGIGDPAAHGLVREIGFGNLAIGTLGILSLFVPDFLLPAAIVGGLFFGLAGTRAPRAQGSDRQGAGRVGVRPCDVRAARRFRRQPRGVI